MHITQVFQAMFAIAFLARSSYSFKLNFYGGNQCTGLNLGEPLVFGPGAGCQTVHAGVALGVIVESTGPIDDPFYVVKYSTNDCNPDSEVARGDQGCIGQNYASFNVVSVYDKAANNTGSKSLDTVNTTGTVKPDTLKTADLGSGANPQQKMSQMALVGVMLLYIAFQ